MNIIVTDISCLSIFLFPIVPTNIKIDSPDGNETISTLEAHIRLVGNRKLRSISWESFFPVNKSYNFVPSTVLKNGWLYVTFLELMKKLRLPVRLIFTAKNKIPILNIMATIDNFSYSLDGAGDIVYSISLTEFTDNILSFVDREKEAYKYIGNVVKNGYDKAKLETKGLLAKITKKAL